MRIQRISRPFVHRRLWPALFALLAGLAIATQLAADVRIKDIADIEGVRTHRLTGFGLVAGLNGTGGKGPVTRQFALNMLERFGITSDPVLRSQIRTDAQQKTDNLSVVTVTAEFSVFARPGSRVDVVVSAYDDASSLQGGTLMMTPLVAVDGRVYAMASGPVSIGGFSFSGQGASVVKNHPTTGRIANGAAIEEGLETDFAKDGVIRFLLRKADFETARRMAAAINKVSPASASPLNAGVVQVVVPARHRNKPVDFVGQLGGLVIRPDTAARVVINERTGTVVVGDHVRIGKVAITHANLSVITTETPQVSQPAPLSPGGETVVVPRTQIEVSEERAPVQVVEESVTVGDLARALNALGVTPRDISSIFQALKEAGALHAELKFE